MTLGLDRSFQQQTCRGALPFSPWPVVYISSLPFFTAHSLNLMIIGALAQLLTFSLYLAYRANWSPVAVRHLPIPHSRAGQDFKTCSQSFLFFWSFPFPSLELIGGLKIVGLSSDRLPLVYVDFKYFGSYSPPLPIFPKACIERKQDNDFAAPLNWRLRPVSSIVFKN